MNTLMDIAVRGGSGLLQLLLHPFYYVGLLFVILQYRRQIAMERKLYAVKLHSLLGETGRVVLWGAIGGMAASLVMAFVGATIEPEAVLLLWIISLALIMLRIRFFCWAYAIGVIGIAQALVALVPSIAESASLQWLVEPLLGLSLPALLALIAVLHLAEAMFVRFQGTRMGTPVFLESKRGKIVGGQQIQGFWPVPLLLVVPLSGAGSGPLPWTPLLGGDLWLGGWTIVGLPVMIGFTELTMSRLPKEKTALSSNLLIVYSIVMLLMAWLVFQVPALGWLGALSSIVLHEAILWYSRWDESRKAPIYVHDGRGLKVIGILPGSPAEELGIQIGEIVHKVNGVPVRSKRELYEALQRNPAFCKLEVLNLAGESKFLKRAIFSNEHHQLGIILAPDQDVPYYAEMRPVSVFALLRTRLAGYTSNASQRKSLDR